jgi:hypothetical protein
MTEFKPLIRKPGDTIKAEEWNMIQEGLINEIVRLREYIDTLGYTIILTAAESFIGRAYALDEPIQGGYESFGVKSLGLITKQWVQTSSGDICKFGVFERFEYLQFWACADNGDKKTLSISFEYADGSIEKINDNLFINDKVKLSLSSEENPYIEFISAQIGKEVFYKYQVKNPKPDKAVRYVIFSNVNPACITRIGNVLILKSKVYSL